MLFMSSFLSLGSICCMQSLESLMLWKMDSISLRPAIAAVWRRLQHKMTRCHARSNNAALHFIILSIRLLPEVVWPGLEIKYLLDGGKVLVRDVEEAMAFHPLSLESLPRAQIVCKGMVMV